MWGQVLLASSSSIFFPQLDLPIHKCLLHSLAFGCTMEYSHVTHALTPFSPTPTLVFTTLHPKSNGFFSLFLEDYNYTKTLSFFLIPSNWHSTHTTFIVKWYFWDGFWTFLKLFSPYRFSKWIPSIVPTLFSYCIGSHSTPNCACPWSSLPFSHDQTFRWSSSHCSRKNIVSTHKPCFMLSIQWSFCDTFFPTLIWSCN